MKDDKKTLFNFSKKDIANYQLDNMATLKKSYKFRAGVTNEGKELSPIGDDNSKMIFLTEPVMAALQKPTDIYGGIMSDMSFTFENMTIDDLSDDLYILFEFTNGNPLISNLYLRFYVESFTIHYKIGDKTYNFTSRVDPNIDTYLHTQEGFKDNYRFLSDKLDVMFNPVSYVVCPEEEEKNIPLLSGNVKKVSSEDRIKRKLCMYQSEIYDSDILGISIPNQRQYQQFSWDGLLLRKSSFQDNIQNIVIEQKNKGDVNQKPYTTWIVYNNTIMSPKRRNNKETFYYNEYELDASKYNQNNLHSAVGILSEPSWQIRTNKTMDAIDTWNFEYQNNKDIIMKYAFEGVLNKYGNGYMYLPDETDT